MKRLQGFMTCIITIVLVLVMVNYLGELLRPTDTDIAVSAIESFHELPENTVDVIGYGSSHMWRGLNTKEMSENYGINAYNYGCNWQHINTTALFFKDSLRTQKPKVAIIDTFNVANLLLHTDINGEIYYTRAISNFDGKREYLKQCFGDDLERYLSYYMPLCAFHDNWVNLKISNWSKVDQNEEFKQNKGFMASWDAVHPLVLEDSNAFEQHELNKYAIKILDEIVAICKQEGIELIFITIPWKGLFEYHDALTAYAEENECTYLDFFELIDDVGISGDTDFSDEGHLNTSGATKMADYLGKYITENYDLNDSL